MIRPPCEVTNWQLAHKTAFRLCFTRLILTLKHRPECTKMHHCQTKKSKKNLGEGHGPSPDLSSTRKGIPPSQTPPPRRLRRLDFRAFGAQRSRSFSFTTQKGLWICLLWRFKPTANKKVRYGMNIFCSARNRPAIKNEIVTDLAYVHITLMQVRLSRKYRANWAIDLRFASTTTTVGKLRTGTQQLMKNTTKPCRPTACTNDIR